MSESHRIAELQEQINELKAIIMEMRSIMKHHINGYTEYCIED